MYNVIWNPVEELDLQNKTKSMMNTWDLNKKKSTTNSWIYKKKKSMTITWDLDKKLDVEKQYNKYLEVEQKVGQKLQPSVKSTT